MRNDKTRAYYFTIEEVEQLFGTAGFETIENKYFYRVIENRKKEIAMHRVWIQSRFRKPLSEKDREEHQTIKEECKDDDTSKLETSHKDDHVLEP